MPAVVGVEEEPDGVSKIALPEGSRQNKESQAASLVRSRLMRNQGQVKAGCSNQALSIVRKPRRFKPLLPVPAVTRRKEKSGEGSEFVPWEGPEEICSSSLLKGKGSNRRGAINEVQLGYRHPWLRLATSGQLWVVGATGSDQAQGPVGKSGRNGEKDGTRCLKGSRQTSSGPSQAKGDMNILQSLSTLSVPAREGEKGAKELQFVFWEGPGEREAGLLDREERAVICKQILV